MEKEHTKTGPLAGIRVLDLTGNAPGPYCTMLLADMGAEVIVVGGGRAGGPVSTFSPGKRFVTLDLKSPAGTKILKEMIKTTDILIEGYRPGVMKRLGLDYETVSEANARLIYCSLTGYGQAGPMASDAGHDINYIALSGVLGSLGPVDQPPLPPLNLVADFAGGSLFALNGILSALYEREKSGQGQYIDAAMIDGCLSMMAMHFPIWETPFMAGRGENFTGGHFPFYRCYQCSDGKYMSVGAIEPQFYASLCANLGLADVPEQMNTALWESTAKQFEAAFKTKTRSEWEQVFDGSDACVAPVLTPDEVWAHPQVQARCQSVQDRSVPPAPALSRSPMNRGEVDESNQTYAVLRELGFMDEDIAAAMPKHSAEMELVQAWPQKV